jgi:hypothetical protein
MNKYLLCLIVSSSVALCSQAASASAKEAEEIARLEQENARLEQENAEIEKQLRFYKNPTHQPTYKSYEIVTPKYDGYFRDCNHKKITGPLGSNNQKLCRLGVNEDQTTIKGLIEDELSNIREMTPDEARQVFQVLNNYSNSFPTQEQAELALEKLKKYYDK